MDFSKYTREQLIKALDQEYRDLSLAAPDDDHDSVEDYLEWLQGLTLEELQEEIIDSVEGDNSYLDENNQITLDDFMARWLQ
jgi:hypothetical protein